jgi:hypothetical protein
MRGPTAPTRIGLLFLTGFVAITAIPGGIWVVPTMPLDWIKAGPFTDYILPAIALFGVGVFAALVCVALIVRPWAGALGSILAGATMVVFELVEVGVVGFTLIDPGPSYFQSWLQVVYLIVGTAQVLLGWRLWRLTRDAAPPIAFIHPATA